MATEKLKRALGIRDVFLFYIVSGLSLRWIASAAAAGQSAITVWVLGFCGFFLPLAGVSWSSLPVIHRKAASTSGRGKHTATLPGLWQRGRIG